jgi:tetracycline repressor-like protein
VKQADQTVVTGLVEATMTAKTAQAEISIALQEPLSEVGGAALVQAAGRQAAVAVAEAIGSCPDVEFEDPLVPARVVITVCSALVQGALDPRSDLPGLETLREHMAELVMGYLRAIGRVEGAGERRRMRRR